MIIAGHCHVDHIGNIPALYSTGKCLAPIVIPSGSISILKEMWLDSAYINMRDAEFLTIKTGKTIEPLFTEEDVTRALQFVKECPSHEICKLNEELSIRFTPAGHILFSQQCELFIGQNKIKKILFTSDLGNIKIQDKKYFVEHFEPVDNAHIVIGECTYCQPGRSVTKKQMATDIQKIKTVVDQFCIDYGRRVLIPVFSLDRTPYMLSILYDLFGKDENFKIPVYIDSPLAIRLLNCYSSVLSGEAKEKFDEMMNWKNLNLIVEPEDSRAAILDHGAKIVLSSSGMLTAGRSIKWVENILPHENDCILFCGYSAEDTLAYKIKNGKTQKTVSINGRPFKNRCQIVSLRSFSSHMQREDLINYYKGIHCEKIYLVHGDKEFKGSFKEDLEKEISRACRTTQVVNVNKTTKISL